MPKLKDDELLTWATEEFRESQAHSSKWRDRAKIAFDYKAGDQWSTDDKAKMEAAGRPIITFNRVGVFVRAVVGLEVSNRQEMIYTPEEVTDSDAVGIANQTSKWARKKNDSEYEQSAAFEDMVTCGMGWTETFIDTEQDLDGKIREEQEDPLRCYWDPAARKPNLADTRWVARLKEFDNRREFERRFPNAKKDNLGESSILGVTDFFADPPGDVHKADKPAYQQEQAYRGTESRTSKIRVLEFQYWEPVEVVRFDGGEGELQTLSPKNFEKLVKRLEKAGRPIPRNLKQFQRHYYMAFFSGSKVLEHKELPREGPDKIPDFTLQCMTGYFDRNNGVWYGIVNDMIDPQNWANKYFSQVHDIFNSGIKGGIWYEESAVKDPDTFEDRVAQPGAAIAFQDGALSNKQVFQPQPASLPAGASQLHQFAVDAIPQINGLNPELMGLAGRDQPGILESQRKQAGLTLLASLFDSLRQYRIRQGRVLLWFIREFMPKDRIARIVGKQNAEYIPAFLTAGAEKFDINVGDAPSSPHMKEKVFTMFMQLIPILGNQAALVLPMLIQYSPFPLEVVKPLLEQLTKSQQDTPEQQIAKRLTAEQAMAEIEKTHSEALLNTAKAEAEADGVALKDTKLMQDLFTKMADISATIELEKMKKQTAGGSNG